MKVLQIYMRNPLRNFNYIVYSEVNDKAIFVDPLDISKTMPRCEEKGLKPSFLLNTHGHHDHIKGNDAFLKNTGSEHLKLKDGEEFHLSETESVKAIHTPGHTKDHYCYLLQENGKAFGILSGDTLFNAGVGNCKNGGDPETLYKSVEEKLSNLPEDLAVYPGHDYMLNNLDFAKSVDPDNDDIDEMRLKRAEQSQDEEFIITTLGQEKKVNPFLRLDALGERLQEETRKGTFLRLRALRDKW